MLGCRGRVGGGAASRSSLSCNWLFPVLLMKRLLCGGCCAQVLSTENKTPAAQGDPGIKQIITPHLLTGECSEFLGGPRLAYLSLGLCY